MFDAFKAKCLSDKYYELDNILQLIEIASTQGEYSISLPAGCVNNRIRSELTKLGFYWISSSSINIYWDKAKEAQ